jgi:hypothetical protein
MIDLARVAEVHRSDNSVDLVMYRDGSHLAGVQVLSWSATTRSGVSEIPEPTMPSSGDKWDLSEMTEQELIAAVAYIGTTPVVLGFLFPQLSQMMFDRKNFRVDRHPSDVYSTLDEEGNFEWSHPSGSHFRVAEDPEHEDLEGQDFDKRWKIDRNTARAPWISLVLKNGGDQVLRLRADPDGNVTLTHTGNLNTHTDGNATIDVDGNVEATVGGTTDVTSAGNLSVTAPVITLNGVVNVIGASLTHNGVNVGSTHVHDGVTAGSADTDVPH